MLFVNRHEFLRALPDLFVRDEIVECVLHSDRPHNSNPLEKYGLKNILIHPEFTSQSAFGKGGQMPWTWLTLLWTFHWVVDEALPGHRQCPRTSFANPQIAYSIHLQFQPRQGRCKNSCSKVFFCSVKSSFLIKPLMLHRKDLSSNGLDLEESISPQTFTCARVSWRRLTAPSWRKSPSKCSFIAPASTSSSWKT